MHLKTYSVSLAKLAGDPWRPIVVTVHWYLVPLPGTVKLLRGLLLLSKACCQNPLVRSIVENGLDSASPILLMQSLISLITYLSGFDFRFTVQ